MNSEEKSDKTKIKQTLVSRGFIKNMKEKFHSNEPMSGVISSFEDHFKDTKLLEECILEMIYSKKKYIVECAVTIVENTCNVLITYTERKSVIEN